MPEEAGNLKPEDADQETVGPGERTPPPPIRTRNRFYRRYGRALSYWASVEQILSAWFASAINPEEEAQHQAREIFYSARSFNGSADMLKAAFYAEPRDEELSEFFKVAINRTMGYYAFRNRLAHYI